jgi:hypothetical protein
MVIMCFFAFVDFFSALACASAGKGVAHFGLGLAWAYL